jgi:CspA family cold shock protein
MADGTVKWFNEHNGYGYITQENGGSLLVRRSEIRASGIPSLEEGDRVKFNIVKGKLCDTAVGVSLICDMAANVAIC